MAAKRRKRLDAFDQDRADQKALREKVYASLWKDPEFVRLDAVKDEWLKKWKRLDAWKHSSKSHGKERAAELALAKKMVKVSLRNLGDYESRAMMKAGAKGFKSSRGEKTLNPQWKVKSRRISRNPMLKKVR